MRRTTWRAGSAATYLHFFWHGMAPLHLRNHVPCHGAQQPRQRRHHRRQLLPLCRAWQILVTTSYDAI